MRSIAIMLSTIPAESITLYTSSGLQELNSGSTSLCPQHCHSTQSERHWRSSCTAIVFFAPTQHTAQCSSDSSRSSCVAALWRAVSPAAASGCSMLSITSKPAIHQSAVSVYDSAYTIVAVAAAFLHRVVISLCETAQFFVHSCFTQQRVLSEATITCLFLSAYTAVVCT
jgi:hypothetical protein